MFEDVKLGDELYSIEHGWGVVIEKSKETYSLFIEFKNYKTHFLPDGRSSTKSMHPTLFWDELKFEVPKKPLPDLKVDTKVLVNSAKGSRKVKRYFKEFDKDGKIVCFAGGNTSWSNDGETTWDYWELVENE